LIEESSRVDYRHVTRSIYEKNGICNPSASPRCGICFPYGKPDIKLIKKYNSDISMMNEDRNLQLAATDLQKATKEQYEGVMPDIKPTIDEQSPSPPPMTSVKERKYIRRLLKAIWSFI